MLRLKVFFLLMCLSVVSSEGNECHWPTELSDAWENYFSRLNPKADEFLSAFIRSVDRQIVQKQDGLEFGILASYLSNQDIKFSPIPPPIFGVNGSLAKEPAVSITVDGVKEHPSNKTKLFAEAKRLGRYPGVKLIYSPSLMTAPDSVCFSEAGMFIQVSAIDLITDTPGPGLAHAAMLADVYQDGKKDA